MATGNPLLDGLMMGQQFANNLLNAPIQRQIMKDQESLMKTKSQNPMMYLTGPAGQMGAADSYPQGSPERQIILQTLQQQTANQQATANWHKAMAETVHQRYAPLIAKQQQYSNLQKMGYSTSQINNMSDAQRAQAAGGQRGVYGPAS